MLLLLLLLLLLSLLLLTKQIIWTCLSRQVSRSFGDERGFLGMAFHPKFSENGRFFVYYATRLTEDDTISEEEAELGIDSLDHLIIISEMRVSAANPNLADADYEKVMLRLKQPFANHNGGEVSRSTYVLILSFSEGVHTL